MAALCYVAGYYAHLFQYGATGHRPWAHRRFDLSLVQFELVTIQGFSLPSQLVAGGSFSQAQLFAFHVSFGFRTPAFSFCDFLLSVLPAAPVCHVAACNGRLALARLSFVIPLELWLCNWDWGSTLLPFFSCFL